jgi:FtsP/CotA-like multicopper oxidase with cupredoxin domain
MKSRIIYSPIFSMLVGSVLALTSIDAFAVTTTINTSSDTTIYQGPVPDDLDGNAENNSCGAGSNIIVGWTDENKNGGSFERRALIKFDIAANLPPGSIINSVTLTMNVNRAGDGVDRELSLHPVTQDWGEGVQNCDAQAGQGVEAADGDATWLDAMFQQTAWGTPGGDREVESAFALIPTRGEAIWDSAANPGMVNDVQNWLDNPATNFGWIVKNQQATPLASTRRFDSSESGAGPVLTIDYTPSGPVEECCDVDGVFNGICSVVAAGTCQSPPDNPNDPATCSPNTCPQPIGACCNLDESCSDGVTAAECLVAGGFFNGDGSACSDNVVDCGLEPFVDPLPWPVPEVQPVTGELGGEASYEITMSQFRQQLHRDLSPTDVWGYDGSYPGPTLEATVNKPISVQFNNDLPVGGHYLTVDTCPHGPNYWRDSSITSIHLHGGHVPSRFDGQPEYTFFPGEFDTYEYPNNQDAATMWYHDHALGITRLNVYMGLAAYYLLRPDCAVTPSHPECDGSLPPKAYEVPAVIQDRSFDENDQLLYPPRIVGGGFFGDKVLVNGKVWPFLNVDQGKYRFRFLNGSQARSYTLRLENLDNPAQVIPFNIIGTDTGLTSAPISVDTIHMVPAERFDVVIDFAGFPAGTEIVLRNDKISAPLLPNVMKFIVQGQPGHTAPLPATLDPVVP